jgi:GNAT superfamily N-acetyltransferase
MDSIDAAGETFTVRRAEAEDVPALVALLADDVIGATREQEDLAPYLAAFEEIDADPHQFLAVVEDPSGGVCGTLQLTLIPGLSRRGATRLQIEAVRLGRSVRGTGLGTALFAWAHDVGRRRGAAFVQLTSDKRRGDAHRFYDRLGYRSSHEGFKLEL